MLQLESKNSTIPILLGYYNIMFWYVIAAGSVIELK